MELLLTRAKLTGSQYYITLLKTNPIASPLTATQLLWMKYFTTIHVSNYLTPASTRSIPDPSVTLIVKGNFAVIQLDTTSYLWRPWVDQCHLKFHDHGCRYPPSSLTFGVINLKLFGRSYMNVLKNPITSKPIKDSLRKYLRDLSIFTYPFIRLDRPVKRDMIAKGSSASCAIPDVFGAFGLDDTETASDGVIFPVLLSIIRSKRSSRFG